MVTVRQMRVQMLIHHNSSVLGETNVTVTNHTTVDFKCPCGHARPAGPPLSQLEPNKPVMCSVCGRPYTSKKWTCPCEISWFSCSAHFSMFQPATRDRIQNKRPLSDNAQQSDRKLARLEAKEIAARPMVLGSILAQRIPHLALAQAPQSRSRQDNGNGSPSSSSVVVNSELVLP